MGSRSLAAPLVSRGSESYGLQSFSKVTPRAFKGHLRVNSTLSLRVPVRTCDVDNQPPKSTGRFLPSGVSGWSLKITHGPVIKVIFSSLLTLTSNLTVASSRERMTIFLGVHFDPLRRRLSSSCGRGFRCLLLPSVTWAVAR